jgi:Cys-tRNA(Pro)/Cys-tRNA(Cys) deacylase
MTPAIVAAQRAHVWFEVHEYPHDPDTPTYGIEAAQVLGLDPTTVFKTLVATADGGRLVIALVPVVHTLNLKALAAAVGAKRAAMADASAAERATGYVVGGISPLGQRKGLPTVVDHSALGLATMYVCAGRRGVELALRPHDLIRLCRATTAAIAR